MKTDIDRLIFNIFETENDSHLIDFETQSGIPVWMIGRYYLMDYVITSKVFSSESPIRYRKVSLKAVSLLVGSLFKNIGNRRLKKHRQIILYTINRKTLIDGKFFNRYVDYFARTLNDDSYVIEQALLDWESPYPRKNNDVVFDVIARVKSEIYGKFHKRRYFGIVTDLIDYYLERVKRILGISFTGPEKANMVKYIAQQICVSEYMARWVEKQITAETKVFIMVGAGFPYNYPVNTVLKKHNVVSVELQHGYITKTSVMYNYAEKILERKETAAGLPDYILTYGEWWNTQMNCPIKKIAVGNPYHDYCFADCRAAADDKKTITVLGAGHNTEKYIELTEYLTETFDDFNVVFRPHPGEIEMALPIVAEKGHKIRIDENNEIYDTLKRSFAVISEITTVLFEAIGIVEKIIVWNNDYAKALLPEHPFESFEQTEELSKIIYGKTTDNYKYSDFWRENWQQNYRDFIESVTNAR